MGLLGWLRSKLAPDPRFFGDLLSVQVVDRHFDLGFEFLSTLPEEMRQPARVWCVLYLAWIFRLMLVEEYGMGYARTALEQTGNRMDQVEPGTDLELFRWFEKLDSMPTEVVVEGESRGRVPPDAAAAQAFLISDAAGPYRLAESRDAYHARGGELRDAADLESWLISALAAARTRALPAMQATMTLGRAYRGIVWSARPGCFERHLQRRHNNPLFPRRLRAVSKAQLEIARTRDARDLARLRLQTRELLNSIVDAPEQTSYSELNALRQRIERLIVRAVPEIGAAATREERSLLELRSRAIATMKTALEPEHAAKLDEIDREWQQVRPALAGRFCAQLNRKDSPIGSTELAAALLSEPLEEIRVTVQVLQSSRALPAVRTSAADLITKVLAAGDKIEGLEDKARALGIALPSNS